MPVDADGTLRAPDGQVITCTDCQVFYQDAQGNPVLVHITQVGDVRYIGYETDGPPPGSAAARTRRSG